jgi:hypothetical protein
VVENVAIFEIGVPEGISGGRVTPGASCDT